MTTRKKTKMEPDDEGVILLAHGGGGALTGRLLEDVILPELANPVLSTLDDAACLTLSSREIAFTTDSYVVDPLFFPGGDIGKLAVCGTVNDLVMQGAEPKFLSLGMILTEGFTVADLRTILRSAAAAAKMAGVQVVTGDTKVVGRKNSRDTAAGQGGSAGASPGLFLNTAGIGIRIPGVDTAVTNARPGDAVLVTGTLGDHGIAIMNVREGLSLESALCSDVRPLWGLMKPVFEAVPALRSLRDPTRGGLAAALCDIAHRSKCCIRIREASLPVRKEVRGSCSILGLDPLNVANEGKAVVVCAEKDAPLVLRILRNHPDGEDACVIGRVDRSPAGLVVMDTRIGGERIVDVPAGEQLPRIC